MARDILLAQTPTVLQVDLYAVAALLGAAVVVIGNLLQLPPVATTLVGAGLCFGLRVLANSPVNPLAYFKTKPRKTEFGVNADSMTNVVSFL